MRILERDKIVKKRNYGEWLGKVYSKYVVKKGKESILWTFITFNLTILISRLIVLDVEKGRALFGYLYIKGYHIHHFYYGIILLIISNWLALIKYKKLYKNFFKRITSIMFGGGLGLVSDEFGLLLTMEFGIKGNYWAPQSYYAIAIGNIIFIFCLLFTKAD
ncbi:hypothetical protein J7K28_03340 [Candidatus Aerophobetes bacterium]|nr:hypothetical protein [Candidatus Aerophobetes bacterium]